MNARTIAALLALPLLAACAPEIESTVYVRDVARVAESGESLSVPALLRVPQSSEESCAEGLPRLIENLRALAPVTGKGKCVAKEGDQLAEIETAMAVVVAGGAVAVPNLFVLEVGPETGAMGRSLTFRLTRTLDEIVKAMAANSDDLQAEFDPALYIFTVNNDADEAVTLYPDHVFVDGKPAFYGADTGQVLDRRAAVEIRFSDVAAEHVSGGKGYRFASVNMAQ